jgi:6-phosphogluconolactonase (cycloisomerase 2 family)
MKAITSIILLIMIALCGCLGSSKSSIAPTIAFAYIVGTGDNAIHALNETSIGDLALTSLPTFPTNPRPVAMALHPSKNFLYVLSQTANTVSGFSIDHTTGILTPVGTALPPTPVCPTTTPAACSTPVGLGINSAGTFLFVLNQGAAAAPPTTPSVPATISIFSIDTTRGLLTPIAGSPFSFASLVAPNPQFITVSPTANFLYVSDGLSGTVSAFAIGGNGTLAEVAGSPFTTGANMAGLLIDPKGQFLYAADSGNNKIAGFSIAASGVLTPLPGSPFPADFGPVALAEDSTGTFVFSANQAGASMNVFKVASGSLTPVGSPVSLVSVGTPLPSFVAVDVTNTFVYVANTGTTNISGFTIHPDGSLTQLTNSPFNLGIGPQWILITK